MPGACAVGLSLLLGICAVSISSQAAAQSRAVRDLDQRLQRVERVLDQSLLELLQEVESLKRDIRRLRGELESQANVIENLQKTNRELYLDTDERLSQLERGDRLPEPGFSGGGLVEGGGLIEDSPSELSPNDSAGDGSAASSGNSVAAEKAAYAKAYDLLASGKNPEAVNAFRAFLKTYPDGTYSDNAWYWQGEAMYAQRNFDDAIAHFLQVIDFFPRSRKVPDARLKVGFAQYESGRFAEARETLIAVRDDYPGRSASVLARRRLEAMDAAGQ